MSIDVVEDIVPRRQYTARAGQTEFDYPFPIFADTDLIVYVGDVLQTITTHYAVDGVGEDHGGTVTFVTAPGTGAVVTLYRDTAIERLTDFQQNGPNRSAALNDELDRIVTIEQELEAKIGRSLRTSQIDTSTSDAMMLPPATHRANKFLYFDSAGNPVVVPGEPPVEPVLVDVTTFGAVGDWDGSAGTDNLAAFNAAYTAAASLALTTGRGAVILIPEGRYLLSDEWNVWRPSSPRVDILIKGADQLATILVCGFYGAGKALIKCVDPTGVARASPTSIRHVGFRHVSTSGGVNPAFIEILGHGESRLEGLRFAGGNNSAMRLYGEQNLRATDIVSFNGGRNFQYKNTAGLTFNVSSGTSTITASAPIFSAGDVGKYFFIFPSNPDQRIRYLINSYIDSTHVTFSNAGLNETGVAGHFEPARGSMTAASNVLTANSNCFTPDMVGMVLYVRRAAAGAFGDALLRGVITAYVAPDQVQLSVAAGNTVTEEYFGVAVLDMGKHPQHPGSSDVKIDKLHIETYSGVAFVGQNTDSYHIAQSKLHGVASVTDTAKALAAIWLDDYGGKFSIDLDTTCSMSDTRVYVCNQNDWVLFDSTISRSIRQGTLFKTELFTDPGGYVELRGFLSYTGSGSGLVDANSNADPTDPRLIITGLVNTLSNSDKAKIFAGRDTYFTPDGRLIRGGTTVGPSYDLALSGASSDPRQLFEHIGTRRWSVGNNGTTFTVRDETAGVDVMRYAVGDQGVTDVDIGSTITWDGTPPSGTTNKRYSWRRVGNIVFFHMRLEYGSAGATNSSLTVALPSDMPTPVGVSGAGAGGEVSQAVIAILSTSSTGGGSLTKGILRNNGAWELVALLNSGTIAATFATFQGHYFTA